MSALVARTASFGRKKKSTTAAAAVPVPAAANADAAPLPGAPGGRAARVANALEARSMLLPGVNASVLPTQNDDMWDGLQESSDEDFEEATQAYIEVCNDTQVAPPAQPHPRLIGRAHAGEHRPCVRMHACDLPPRSARARRVLCVGCCMGVHRSHHSYASLRLTRTAPRLAVRHAVHAYVAEALDGKQCPPGESPALAPPPPPPPPPPPCLLT